MRNLRSRRSYRDSQADPRVWPRSTPAVGGSLIDEVLAQRDELLRGLRHLLWPELAANKEVRLGGVWARALRQSANFWLRREDH